MKPDRIAELIDGEILTCRSIKDRIDIKKGFSADLMSDVLSLLECEHGDVALVTGITNPQIVRTAEILDIPVIIVARGKKIPEETLTIAEDKSIILISTPKTVFETSGILYSNGIKGAKMKK